MLVIEGNAVYEIDCDCLRQKGANSRRFVRCEESVIEKNNIHIQTGTICREQLEYTGKGVTVAILDTGIFPHPDFENRIVGWYDAVSHSDAPFDPNGHGTQEGGKCPGRNNVEIKK